MILHARNATEVSLSEGSVIISVDCLVPNGGNFDYDVGRVDVPDGVSLKFPASFYSLSKEETKKVQDSCHCEQLLHRVWRLRPAPWSFPFILFLDC